MRLVAGLGNYRFRKYILDYILGEKMSDFKVFYSWQKDVASKLNRSFIQNVLEKAAKEIRNDDSIEIEPVIDRDTQNAPGSPNIVNVIFDKIEAAQVW